MTTLQPRGPYSPEELKKLYPEGLQLQLVQVLLRHGERSPVSARFQNAGLGPFWPYCAVARQMVSSTIEASEAKWSSLQWRRRLETFGPDDGPVIAAGPRGEVDAVCNLGELTDKGRQTTWNLGSRLRHLYVDQLRFMPPVINNTDSIYLRATPIPRALDSLQQTFWGMYPSSTRATPFPPITIVTRAPADETLFPNDGNCRRFAQLSRAFAQRTADRWNATSDMEYLNKLISKWMPETGNKRVAVDSHPRLSGIMDTINSTLAHGPETRLPKEFYDDKARAIIEKIGVEEWFSGYQESQEYRALGIGGLMGDVVTRMVGSVEHNGNDGSIEIGGKDGHLGGGQGNKAIKLALSGCHDTTLAAVLASLGAFQGEPWPPYTSHIALELFRRSNAESVEIGRKRKRDETSPAEIANPPIKKTWLGGIFGDVRESRGNMNETKPAGIARRSTESLTEAEKSKLDGYFVRIRYNDKVMSVPGCKPAGKHLDGDESFCTLAAFKAVVDKYTPSHWKMACLSNMEAPAIPQTPEPSGY
ncbi:putative acid phosphatase [Hyphodiscus hymeniophilus]|uniref:3-phytase n=1 Tax=Hyphodiscus hymeniophilus TaxID=353542 RepID=A0A9P6VR69_9HELO|nr:putative acid phosphatase [Hyphodiscus hymeniophilus]